MHIPFDIKSASQRQAARLSSGENGSLLLADGAGPGFQTVDLLHRDLARAVVRMRMCLRPSENGEAQFSLTQGAGKEIALIARDGALVGSAEGSVLEYACAPDAEGWLHLDILFRNAPPSLSLGLPRPTVRYAGTGAVQFALKDIDIEIVEPRWTPTADDKLVVFDAPGQVKIDPLWAPFLDGLQVIVGDPDEKAGAAALAALPADGGHILLPRTLSSRNGSGKFNTARNPAMNSTLDADHPRLKSYLAAPGFEVIARSKPDLSRYDTLSRQLALPQPDMVRLAAGGAEYDVLRGFGNTLDHVLGVAVQAYLYPLYRKQKLLGDVVDLLDGSGLVLRRLVPRPLAHYDNELVAATAYFTRRTAKPEAVGKLAFIEEMWGIARAA